MNTRDHSQQLSCDSVAEAGALDEPHLSEPTGEEGMTTAEYAVGTIAAVAFAAVLYKIVQSPQVHDMLVHIVTSALNFRL